jgi:hypothetical protein
MCGVRRRAWTWSAGLSVVSSELVNRAAMAKTKSRAVIKVADGRGGMVQVQDRRFEKTRDWPVRVDVPVEQADTWLEYLYAECERRGWSSNTISQLEAHENSGTVNVNSGSADKPELSVVWERRRGAGLHIRARSNGAQPLSDTAVQQLFDEVIARCHSGTLVQVHRCWHLEFHGLPWQGEFWLSETLRLGPPSRQYTDAMYGARAVMVDAVVSCVRASSAPEAFQKQLRELSMFLSVVMGTAVHVTRSGRSAWTWTQGATDCQVRNLGYWDSHYPTEMPARGTCAATPLRTVHRPDFASRGLEDQTIGEASLPSDINELWASFRALTADRRRQFLQAAAKWQEALIHWGERDTLSAALLVVACEALKPGEAPFRDSNIYHVVEALLGESIAEQLNVGWFRAQAVRNAHLHAGEFIGSEFVHAAMSSSFEDPTFDQARRALAPVAREAIIEWLRRGGVYAMVAPTRRGKTLFRRAREHRVMFLLVAAIAFTLGFVLATI